MLAVGMSGAYYQDQIWTFLAYAVLGNYLLILLTRLIDNQVLRRRYPVRHNHHPHHVEFQQTHSQASRA
jgi:CBS-domain-containing membrane protein